MSTRFPGGFINRSAPVVVGPSATSGGSAPGVWTLEQAGYYRSKSQWPIPPSYEIYAWGYNSAYQVGDGTTVARSSPVMIGTVPFTHIAAGFGSAGLTQDGKVYNWGRNSDGAFGTNNRTTRSTPTLNNVFMGVKSAASQANTMAFVKYDGTLWTCGENTLGQLGVSDTVNRSSPVQIGVLTTWSTVSGNYFSFLATKSDGTLWGWGYNNKGELGVGDEIARSSPVQIGADTNWSKVACGSSSLAIKTDGTLWSWGNNGDGQLGNNTTANSSSPAQVGALTNWSEVSTCGNVSSGSCVAIKTNNTAWAWGVNGSGQLGLNSIVSKSSPTQIGALTIWEKAENNDTTSSCFLRTDGTIWSCGANNFGQLGQNVESTVNRSSPVQIGTATNWVDIFTSGSTANMFAVYEKFI